MQTFEIEAVWDNDAAVWVAQSDSVPGLVAEAASRALLSEKLTQLVPELLELNHYPTDPPIELAVHFHREQRIRLPQAA
jgi:uncharacterized protein DUF1902